MCRCVLLSVLWLLIGIRLRLLAVELLNTAGTLYHTQCCYGTVLVTLCFMVWDWQVLRARQMFIYWTKLLAPLLLLVFSFS